MKILVTGTAGFIGFHLARRLLDQGDTVVGLDCFSDYYDVRLKQARHQLLEDHPAYRGVRADVCEHERLLELFRAERFDHVVHLAAQAGVRYSLDHPFVYVKANIEGFLSVLEACRHAGVRKLVYASSSSVYGANRKLPFSERDRVDQPVSLYSATKRADELMAHSYSHLYDLQTVGLRFFTVYGPWGRPDMAMWLFADKIWRGDPLPLFNHGKMRRDFTYIDDIVNGICGAVRADDLETCSIFNLGNHRSENLLDMVHELERALGKSARLEMLPMQAGDVSATYADIRLAQEKLGFAPSTPISVGIPRFVAWFKEYHGIS